VIAAKAPEVHRAPASLTKLMTVYLTYEALKAGALQLNQTVPVSVDARKATGSRMFIQPGMPVTIGQLIAGLMIDSGNDAAVALAEAIAGTQDNFVTMMNKTAGLLHLADTHYTNVNGLPKPDLYTSALDLARLSRNIIARFPDILEVSKQQYYTYNKIRQRSWNPVLFRDSSVDGLKTGLTDASGHCIDATASRDGRRLIAVVMGGPSWSASSNDVEALLDYGYRFFKNRTLVSRGETVGALDNPLRDPTHVSLGAGKTVVMTLPASPGVKLDRVLSLLPARNGAIAKGAVVGEVAIRLNGKTIATAPAVTLTASQPAGLEQRLVYKLKQLW
jgi:serine-type D-Ala-D-Ala carboxypeptidase (penicillin-binding protein 5/6)